MLYSEYINKAKEITIERTDNGVWYLIPEWKYILYRNEMAILKFRDFKPDWYTIEDNLKLEVERRNKRDSNTKTVVDWAHGIISTNVEPAMLQEETDYIKNVMEYMKLNHSIEAS